MCVCVPVPIVEVFILGSKSIIASKIWHNESVTLKTFHCISYTLETGKQMHTKGELNYVYVFRMIRALCFEWCK